MLKHAYVTEKATAQLDRENKLTFIADVEDTKDDIKKAVEKIYNVTVVDVKTLVTPKGCKKATITFSSADSAEEIASKLGMFQRSRDMGKRIISQNRGKGTAAYRAPSHRYKAALKLIKADKDEDVKARVVEVLHDPARSAPIARVELADGTERLILVQEGLCWGDELACGASAEVKAGNILPLAEIPEGVPICSIESQPGDGGCFARASGVYG